MHAGLKRNFQLMPGTEWLELLCRHIPDRYEHLVRYVGWYSNRVSGERAKRGMSEHATEALATPPEPMAEIAARAKATWARLIRKVYEADPLECPKCHGPMWVIALIDDPPIVRRILEHLGRWAPLYPPSVARPSPTGRLGPSSPSPTVPSPTSRSRSARAKLLPSLQRATLPRRAPSGIESPIRHPPGHPGCRVPCASKLLQEQEPATPRLAHRGMDPPATTGRTPRPQSPTLHSKFMTPGVAKTLTRSDPRA